MKGIVNFFYEAGQLKRSKRNGWPHLGIQNPESIADHSWRTALISFVLAKMEGMDPKKVTVMAVWHEIAETRILDLDKVAQRYFTNKHAAEKQAFDEQIEFATRDCLSDQRIL